jgi:ferredoxin
MGVISSFGAAPGMPVIDAGRCLHCGKCAAICPVEVLQSVNGAITVNNDVNFGCITCGQCMMVCPNGSITVTGRNLSPQDIIDLAPRERRATAEQLASLMLARRSIRSFVNADVPRETIERIIDAASSAPMGIPPSEVGITVISGRSMVAELAKDTARGYVGMLKAMDNRLARWIGRLVMKKSVYDRFDSFIIPLGKAIVTGEREGKDYVLYNAPAALLFHVSPYTDNADAIIACTYAMLAAESEGLGTCMIGCVAPILARSKALKRKYRIPEGHSPALVLIMGYHDSPHLKGIRRRFLSVNYL